MPVPVLLDCDPGIDDALAIALLLGTDQVELVGITTVAGNVAQETTTANALRLTEFYGHPEVAVVPGAKHPLTRANVFAEYVHGRDGLGGAPIPAATRPAADGYGPDFIVEQLRRRPGEITLVAVGPMTNLALALRKEPRIAEWAKTVVLMGGSWTRGNITAAAEFNFYADPEAAAAVFHAPWEPVLVGLDLTLQARVDDTVMDRWRRYGELSDRLLVPSLANYFDNRAAEGTIKAPRSHVSAGVGPAVHDACAAAYAFRPDLFAAMPALTRIETHGEYTSGMSVVDFTAPPRPAGEATSHTSVHANSTVLTEIDVPAFWDLMSDSFAVLARRMQQS
ncbi:nucleoside hydrolase [Cumulibacter manganitolerans]|uniref:nucleoside hydrolase n=1 Tax=Cumulibacter manganitolerans TaxID=1884992 RepID=UPI001297C1F5|nr:nucleoside hydrolase [Cumulibacter manganitolerans]